MRLNIKIKKAAKGKKKYMRLIDNNMQKTSPFLHMHVWFQFPPHQSTWKYWEASNRYALEAKKFSIKPEKRLKLVKEAIHTENLEKVERGGLTRGI